MNFIKTEAGAGNVTVHVGYMTRNALYTAMLDDPTIDEDQSNDYIELTHAIFRVLLARMLKGWVISKNDSYDEFELYGPVPKGVDLNRAIENIALITSQHVDEITGRNGDDESDEMTV